MHFNQESAENETFTRAWVQAIDGVNSGYRFVGNGALAYDTYNVSTPCSYGGLVYAFTDSTMRFWKPGTATNGALICLQDKLGEGTNTQASSHGIAIVRSWQLVKADQKVWLDSPVAGNCRGETVLTCHFSDIPLSTWTWSRKYGDSWSTFMENGTQIGPNPSSVREEMNVSFSLIIEGADNMARGWYKCGVGQFVSEEKWLDMECKPECAAVFLTPEKHLEIVLANVHPIPKIDLILKDEAFKDVAIDFQRYCGGNRWTLTCRWITTTPLQDGQYFYRLVATTVTDTLFIGTIN
ncbi:uncharacterized protein LOC123551022 isoform X2 [Mercenaria mercenaria]|uniref:uncharacterized protein LOC123551022 isoform X2 n=1 Tax=Mercenaria mercenaria TaxID=6596 RepID=UPI00234E8D3C|nr:uncharacterized protein LOC123551022 isoform X2 [Mercenaria mercenaria]